MPFWRREEKLHERLAREGGLQPAEPPPHDLQPRWGETAIHGIHRPSEWDAVAWVEAEGPPVPAFEFVVLADGTILLDEGDPDTETVVPLAAEVEKQLDLPYRAAAARREGDWWWIGAKAIDVVELPEEIDGDEIVLSHLHGERTLEVDGREISGTVPELEALGEHDSFVVHARRLDETNWEVAVTPL